MEVDPQVEIIAGFDDNSKSEQTGTPFWQESFVIAPRIKVDITIPGYDQNMPTAYWGDDNCLYAPMKIYPSWFPTPPVLGFFNSNDQRKILGSRDDAIKLADNVFLQKLGAPTKIILVPLLPIPGTFYRMGRIIRPRQKNLA